MNFRNCMLADDALAERARLFEDFFASDRGFAGGARVYRARVAAALAALAAGGAQRVYVNVGDVREVHPGAAAGLVAEPDAWLPAVRAGLLEAANGILAGGAVADAGGVASKLRTSPLAVGLEGALGGAAVSPRALGAGDLGRAVCVDGVVSGVSAVRARLLRSVHWSPARRQFLAREYADGDAAYPTTVASPDGSERLESEFGLCAYADRQGAVLQEAPEAAPAGQLPRAVDVVLEDDLVDAAKPGDRVRVLGVLRALPPPGGAALPPVFRTALYALGVVRLCADAPGSSLSADDVANIRAVARGRGALDLLARSLAPSIFGHGDVKRALLLQLLGGAEKTLAGGTHLRGDVNVLLVGDPSTAKSQLLRFVLRAAPLAVSATGRGSSGVGLTAAVATDRESGERRLDAGAFVLADRGIVCIDEFDKMADGDRVAIHEAMEQQSVTVAKAGIHVSLNARCAVLAAANPVRAHWDDRLPPADNVRLSDALLSRFDLVHVVRDAASPETDAAIAAHVLAMHRHVPAGLAEGEPVSDALLARLSGASLDGESDGAPGNAPVYVRAADGSDVLSVQFVRRFVAHARGLPAPALSPAACADIAAAYVAFRQAWAAAPAGASVAPVTPRTLETLVRLATAHARGRLAARVDARDVAAAREMVHASLFAGGRVRRPKRASKAARVSKQETAERDSDSDADPDAMAVESSLPAGDLPADDSSHSHTHPSQTAAAPHPGTFVDPSSQPDTPAASRDDVRAVMAAINRLRQGSLGALFACSRADLAAELGRAGAPPETIAALDAAVARLRADGLVMLDGDNIHLI